MHLIDEPENLRIGFDALQRELELLIHSVEHIQDVLVDAAEAYVNDLRRLPKPYSKIRSSQHKHMLDEMGYRRAKHEEVEVGSGVYWLRFVEFGTRASSKRRWGTPRQPFLGPTYALNQSKYTKIMIEKLKLEL